MMELKRRLAVILSADVSGSDRCRREGKASTVSSVAMLRQIVADHAEQRGGRMADSPEDNLLAEFDSVVDAVQCAVAIQKEFLSRIAEHSDGDTMACRIGVNLGDILEEGALIYGKGAEVANHLAAIADPGGVCISKTVFDHVESKVPLNYEYLGERSFKNVSGPVGVYRLSMARRISKAGQMKKIFPKWRRRTFLFVIIFLLSIFSAVGVWRLYSGFSPQKRIVASEEKVNTLPDTPSIAVMPFDNMSGDAGQDYFSDGITEDIITALSAIPNLSVIARNSTFTYKGKPVNIQQAGRELGARYILEGSIQKTGEQIRITAQLIDAETSHHLWAERYDRELKDIFTLQDEITLNIVRQLQIKLSEGKRHSIKSKAPKSLEAYLKFLKGRGYFMRPNVENNVKARELFSDAVVFDPEYPAAYMALARTYLRDVWFCWSRSPEESLMRASELAEKAVSLDASDAGSHALLSQIYLFKGNREKAIEEGERALTLNAKSVEGYGALGMSLYYAGRYEEAVRMYHKGIALDPTPPTWLWHNLGNGYLMTHQYDEAITAYKKALLRNPESLWAHVGLAAVYSLSGREKEARAAAERVRQATPLFSLEYFDKIAPYKNWADKQRLIEALRKTGLV